MTSSLKCLLSLLLLVIAPQVFAGPFDPPPTDQSVHLLGVIFGDSVGNIYLGGNANPVLANLMEKFNFIIVVVGIVIVSYVAILSTINTAQEGSAMGKKWSAIWVPLRSVAGMALMVPAPASGYSMIQVTVMWIIIQGIGAADSLWNIALDGLASGTSASFGSGTTVNTDGASDPRLSPANIEVQNLVYKIADASICMQTLYAAASLPENVQGGTWLGKNGQYIKNFSIQDKAAEITSGNINSKNRIATVTGSSYFGVNNPNDRAGMSVCGKLNVRATVTESQDLKNSNSERIPDADLLQMAQLIYDTKIKAISSMLYVLNPLVDGMVSGQYSTEKYSAATGFNPPQYIKPPSGYRTAAANAYVLAMKSLVVPSTAVGDGTIESEDQARTRNIIDAGKESGWVTAGSFYFVFNKSYTSMIFKSAIPGNDSIVQESGNEVPECNGSGDNSCVNRVLGDTPADGNSIPSIQQLGSRGISSNATLDLLARNLANNNYFLGQDNTGMPPKLSFMSGGTGSGPSAEIIGVFTVSGAQIIDLMSHLMSSQGDGSGGDPLLAHAYFGRSIMLIMEYAVLAILAIVIALGVVGAAVGWFFPGVAVAAATLTGYLLGVVAIIVPLIALVWSLGAMLAVYTPLIPYMIFTMGVVGWFLVVVEAIIAAPIIALGLVLPSQDEMGKVASALSILANIFLRPMLMIFGFLLASNLFKAVIQLIDFGMAEVFNTIAVETLFSFIVILTVYVTFIMSVTNICFSLIYAIPDKILRWIGGGNESTSASNVDQVKSGAQGATNQIGGGLKSIAEKAGKSADDKAAARLTAGKGGQGGEIKGGEVKGGEVKGGEVKGGEVKGG